MSPTITARTNIAAGSSSSPMISSFDSSSSSPLTSLSYNFTRNLSLPFSSVISVISGVDHNQPNLIYLLNNDSDYNIRTFNIVTGEQEHSINYRSDSWRFRWPNAVTAGAIKSAGDSIIVYDDSLNYGIIRLNAQNGSWISAWRLEAQIFVFTVDISNTRILLLTSYHSVYQMQLRYINNGSLINNAAINGNYGGLTQLSNGSYFVISSYTSIAEYDENLDYKRIINLSGKSRPLYDLLVDQYDTIVSLVDNGICLVYQYQPLYVSCLESPSLPFLSAMNSITQTTNGELIVLTSRLNNTNNRTSEIMIFSPSNPITPPMTSTIHSPSSSTGSRSLSSTSRFLSSSSSLFTTAKLAISSSTANSNKNINESSSSRLTSGDIATMVLLAVLFLVIVLTIILYFRRRNARKTAARRAEMSELVQPMINSSSQSSPNISLPIAPLPQSPQFSPLSYSPLSNNTVTANVNSHRSLFDNQVFSSLPARYAAPI